MNVALLIDDLSCGGAEGVVRRLALGLAGRGHRSFIYCLKRVDGRHGGRPLHSGGHLDRLEAGGVIVREAAGQGHPWRVLHTLGRWLRRDSIEIAHCHSCAALVWTLPIAKLLGIPVLHVRHGWSLGARSRYVRLAEWLGPLADAVGVNCESGRRRLPAHLARRAIYLPNGVDPLPLPRAEARRRLEELCGRPLPAPVVLTLANIRAEKDYVGLLQAMARLRRHRPEVTLVCCGSVEDPGYWVEVQRQQHQLDLQSSVVFAGFCENADRLLPAADVFCLASRTEAMPNAVLEAMAQQVPIVATAVGDLGSLDPRDAVVAADLPAATHAAQAGPRVGRSNVAADLRVGRGAEFALLRHNHTALLVPPGDPAALAEALRLALQDPEGARARARRAVVRHAEMFTTARMVDRYEQFYLACRAGRESAPRCRMDRVPVRRPAPAQAGGRRPLRSKRPTRRRPLRAARRPRVLMLGPAPPQTGGMVTSIGLLMRSPLRWQYELHRLGTPLPTSPALCDTAGSGGGRLVRRLVAAWRHLAMLVRLVRMLRGRRFDLVHIHTCSHLTFYRNLIDMLLAKWAGCRVVLHVRGGKFARFCAGRRPLGRWVIRRGLETADAVIVLSRGIRRAVRPHAGRARLLVVPNAFDPDVLRSDGRHGDRPLHSDGRHGDRPLHSDGRHGDRPLHSDGRHGGRPLSEDRASGRESGTPGPFRFLFLGALTEAKGLGDLLAAASLLRDGRHGDRPLHSNGRHGDRPLHCRGGVPFELCLAGPAGAGQRRRWEQRLRELGLADVTRLAGVVSGMAKHELLAWADCLVHPSHSEGLPNVVLEAAAAGVPIIATAVGALPEALSREHDGQRGPIVPLVPPHDPHALARAMHRITQDEFYRRSVARAVQQHVLNNYSLVRIAENVSSVYRQVLAQIDDEAVETEPGGLRSAEKQAGCLFRPVKRQPGAPQARCTGQTPVPPPVPLTAAIVPDRR